MINVFIIGSKGIPAKYGGFETFVDGLTAKKRTNKIKYHVSCLADNRKEFEYNNSRCFNVKVPEIGSAKAVLYDSLSLNECIKYISENNLKNCIVYILTCRIGPIFLGYKRKLDNLGVKVFVNPDGHEWKRSKWNSAIKKYWKISERLMIKHADLIVCDSKAIEEYIRNEYNSYSPKTTFIAYGANLEKSTLLNNDPKISKWFEKFRITSNNYHLIVGRFVPENNYELMIREFMKSETKKDLVIITNIEENKFYKELKEKTNFEQDKRIKFVGTVYEQDLLCKIREEAFTYIHGHEVGGTNPSLLEALASTKLNLLLNVNFNKEVGGEGAFYFSKVECDLSKLINKVDKLEKWDIEEYEKKAKKRISEHYSWDLIVNQYEDLFYKNK